MDSNIIRLKEGKNKIGSWGNLVQSRLEAALKYSGNQVLDAGCSTGAYVSYLCEHGYDAYGFDLLPDEKWCGKYESRFVIGDICNIPFNNNSFDTILAFEVLEHVENIDLALKELYRVARKNIIISVPNCSQPKIFQKSGMAFHHWVDRTHKQVFTELILRNKLHQSGFCIDVVKYINQIYPESLFLYRLYFPMRIACSIGELVSRIPTKKKWYMTILLVASKNKDGGIR